MLSPLFSREGNPEKIYLRFCPFLQLFALLFKVCLRKIYQTRKTGAEKILKTRDNLVQVFLLNPLKTGIHENTILQANTG